MGFMMVFAVALAAVEVGAAVTVEVMVEVAEVVTVAVAVAVALMMCTPQRIPHLQILLIPLIRRFLQPPLPLHTLIWLLIPNKGITL
jgi:hypothetical protein